MSAGTERVPIHCVIVREVPEQTYKLEAVPQTLQKPWDSTVTFPCFQAAAWSPLFQTSQPERYASSQEQVLWKLCYLLQTSFPGVTHEIWVTVLLQKTGGAEDWGGAPLNPQMEGSQLSLQSTPDAQVLTVLQAASKVSCTEQIAVQQKPGRPTDSCEPHGETQWKSPATNSHLTANYVSRGIHLTATAS